MRDLRIVSPRSVPEAIELLAAPGAAPLGGGVGLMLQQARGEALPPILVSLRGIAGLTAIEVGDGVVELGAMAPLTSIGRSPHVAALIPGLRDAIAEVGSPRIRNQATIGGNVAARVPRHDPPIMLIALDARVRLAGPRGLREVPLESWTLDDHARRAGEVITSVVVPVGDRRGVGRYHAIRTTGGHAAAAARLVIGPDGAVRDARLVIADAYLPPRRVALAEAALRGRRLDPRAVEDVAGLVTVEGVASEGEQAWYHRQLVRTAVRRVLTAEDASARATDQVADR